MIISFDLCPETMYSSPTIKYIIHIKETQNIKGSKNRSNGPSIDVGHLLSPLYNLDHVQSNVLGVSG